MIVEVHRESEPCEHRLLQNTQNDWHEEDPDRPLPVPFSMWHSGRILDVAMSVFWLRIQALGSSRWFPELRFLLL